MQLVDAGGYLTGKFARLPGDDRVRLLMIADPGIIEGAVRLLRLWAIAAAFGLRALPRLFAHSRGGCNYKGMRATAQRRPAVADSDQPLVGAVRSSS